MHQTKAGFCSPTVINRNSDRIPFGPYERQTLRCHTEILKCNNFPLPALPLCLYTGRFFFQGDLLISAAQQRNRQLFSWFRNSPPSVEPGVTFFRNIGELLSYTASCTRRQSSNVHCLQRILSSSGGTTERSVH